MKPATDSPVIDDGAPKTVGPEAKGALRVVLIEDSPSDALMVRAALTEQLGRFECRTAETLGAGLAIIDAFAPTVVLLDLGLPDSDGLDAIDAVHRSAPGLPIIVLTGLDGDRVGQEAISRGAQDYLIKGRDDARTLSRCIHYAIERKRIARELRHSRELLDQIFDYIPDNVFVKDADTLAFVRVNPAAESLFECTEAGLIGKTEGHIVPNATAKASLANDLAALANGTLLDIPVESVETLRRGRRIMHSRRIPLHRNGDQPTNLLTIYEDITERESYKAEQLFHLLVDSVTEYAIYLLDPAGRISSWNAGAQSIYGCTGDEALGQHVSIFHTAEDIAAGRHTDGLSTASSQGRFEADAWRVRKDGSRFWANVVMTPVYDNGGVLVGIANVTRDLSERRRADRRMMDLVPDAIIGCDLDDRVTSWNQAAETTYGWTVDEALGRPLDELVSDEAASDTSARVRSVIESGHWDGEQQHRTKDGRSITVECRWMVRSDSDGRPSGLFATIRDITARREMEAALEKGRALLAQQADQLVRSNAELEQFAYVASHDLSEPLRAVAGFVQLLAQRYQGKLDEDADEFIGFAIDGVRRMQTLIQDLLTFSRLGRLEFSVAPVDCDRLVQEVADELGAAAVVSRSDLPVVSADAGQLRRVFQNLISNAIKFMPDDRRPRVMVSARAEDGYWQISVADNGIGIPSQFHERIFKMFQRLHSGDDYPGTGIGLSVCQRIVDRHGGRIWLESVEGEGSTFHFTIPTRVETP